MLHPHAPSVEFYDPRRVPSDFFSQDKRQTEEILETKLGFQRPRGGDQLPVYSDIDFMLFVFTSQASLFRYYLPQDRYM